MSHPHSLEICCFAGQNMVVQCTSAGQCTGPSEIGELLLLKQRLQQKMFTRQPLALPNIY